MRRALLIPVAVMLTFAAPACGSDDTEEPAATTAPITEPETIPEETQPDRSAERARILLAPVLSSGGCPPDVTVPEIDGGSDPGSESDAAGEAEADAADAAAETDTDTDPTTETTTDTDTDTDTETEGPFPSADGVFCYTVGEPVADGNDLTDATLSENDGGWQVFSHFKADSTDKLNELFNACYAGEHTCPPGGSGFGSVAIIWEGIVLHAPAIQAEDLADVPISLVGGLTERRARDLITIINR